MSRLLVWVFIIFFIIIIAAIYYKPFNNSGWSILDDGIPTYKKALEKLQNRDAKSLFDAVKIYRFISVPEPTDDEKRGDDGIGNLEKCITILNHIIWGGAYTYSDKEKAKTILRDVERERQIEMGLLGPPVLVFTRNYEHAIVDRLPRNRRPERQIEQRPELRRANVNAFFPEIVNILPETYDRNLELAILNSLRVTRRADLDQKDLDDILIEERRQRALAEERANAPVVLMDRQNVHDHMVVDSVKKGIANIKTQNGHIGVTGDSNWDSDLRNNITDYKATKTANKMLSNNIIIAAYESSERDILKNVWNRINDPINSDRRNDMIKILNEQLIDGHDVCTMGRCSRVLQTLENTDKRDSVKIVPEWAILREMNGYAHILYNEMLDDVNRGPMEKLEDDLTTGEREVVADFKKKYGEKLNEKFNADYSGSMSRDTIVAKVKDIVDGI
jgi:hypothetical protein